MSKFMVNLTAVNPSERHRRTPPVEVMVDTGSEVSWLPKKELLDIGITPEGKKKYAMANKQIIERDIGYAILTAEGYSTIDEVVFAEEGDMSLLGVRTLEGFSVMVDNIGHRFVATTSFVCQNAKIKDRKNNIFAQADIILENSEKVMVIEVKTKLTTEDITEHLERMGKLRTHADLHGDKRKYLGAVAAIVTTDNEKAFAFKNGFYVLEPSGETFTIAVPEGSYSVREW